LRRESVNGLISSADRMNSDTAGLRKVSRGKC
jgi:hypothetical protein